MATIPVKYMHSGMAGAPLNGTVGAMIAVLDARPHQRLPG